MSQEFLSRIDAEIAHVNADASFRIELAIRTRQIAKAALDIDGGRGMLIKLQLEEILQQIVDIKALLKKAEKL